MYSHYKYSEKQTFQPRSLAKTRSYSLETQQLSWHQEMLRVDEKYRLFWDLASDYVSACEFPTRMDQPFFFP